MFPTPGIVLTPYQYLKNPFARQALSALDHTTLNLQFHAQFICEPLKSLFYRNLSLGGICNVLPFLTHRFNHVFREEIGIGNTQFVIGLDTLCASTHDDPDKCAKAMTIADMKDFYRLSPEDFETRGPQTQTLNEKWRTFESDVVDCYKAYPGVEYHFTHFVIVRKSCSSAVFPANFP